MSPILLNKVISNSELLNTELIEPYILYNFKTFFQFKVDRLQIIVVAKKYIYLSQLFISRMPKMRAILQLVSAPLNPIGQLQNILGGATHRVSTVADNTYK